MIYWTLFLSLLLLVFLFAITQYYSKALTFLEDNINFIDRVLTLNFVIVNIVTIGIFFFINHTVSLSMIGVYTVIVIVFVIKGLGFFDFWLEMAYSPALFFVFLLSLAAVLVYAIYSANQGLLLQSIYLMSAVYFFVIISVTQSLKIVRSLDKSKLITENETIVLSTEYVNSLLQELGTKETFIVELKALKITFTEDRDRLESSFAELEENVVESLHEILNIVLPIDEVENVLEHLLKNMKSYERSLPEKYYKTVEDIFRLYQIQENLLNQNIEQLDDIISVIEDKIHIFEELKSKVKVPKIEKKEQKEVHRKAKHDKVASKPKKV